MDQRYKYFCLEAFWFFIVLIFLFLLYLKETIIEKIEREREIALQSTSGLTNYYNRQK